MSTPIERSDIRVGDYILATTMDDGVLIERRGKVETISQFGTLGNLAGGYIHNPSWAGKYTFQLIDRPKPKLPVHAGAVIIADRITGLGSPHTPLSLRHDGWWISLATGKPFSASSIIEWTPAKIVEVAQ